MRTTIGTKQYVVTASPALVSWFHQQNVLLRFVILILVTLDSSVTHYNSLAWTSSKANTSYRRSYSIMKESHVCDLYLHPSSSLPRHYGIIGRRTCELQYTSMDTIGADDIDTNTTTQPPRPFCFYQSPINNRWKQRIDIQDLVVGQELQGVIVQEKLTNTTTGPKVWLDVGVCRWSSKGKPYIKDMTNSNNKTNNNTSSSSYHYFYPKVADGKYESVIRKKIGRLRNKATITVYVSRILIHEGRFDVVLSPEEVPSSPTPTEVPSLQSVSKLNVGDEVTGTVTKIVDYGVFIKLDGYNRGGLLHIRQVADLYDTYIDKKQGLIDSGLSPKSRVRLQVMEKNKKRILFDFTNDVKQIAKEEQRQEQEESERQQNELRAQLQQQREKARNIDTMVDSNNTNMSPTSDSSGVAIENSDISVQSKVNISVEDTSEDESRDEEEEHEEVDEEEEVEYDNYDEEREIEDALGLGMY